MKQQITYKGTSIRLPTDSSIETLQPKREWHDIFKVMKGKNLQPRRPYPASLSFRFDGETKRFPAKVKRIQHHQTGFTTNTKGTSLGRKHREGKDLQKINLYICVSFAVQHTGLSLPSF